jgi:hypothetical protein
MRTQTVRKYLFVATLVGVGCSPPNAVHHPTAPSAADRAIASANAGECRYLCADYGYEAGECWEGWQCDAAGKCLSYVGTPAHPDSCPPICTPTNNCPAGGNCGTVDDGCGGQVSCGPGCASPQTCGGGGTPNVCGCTPTNSCKPGSCGVIADGCGGTINCGPCPICGVPAAVPATGGVLYGSTSGASTFSSSCGGGGAPEEYFAWTPQVSGRATASTCGSNFDTVLDVLGDSCPNGNLLGCNDNTTVWCYGSTNTSLVDFDVVAGKTYFFAVDGAGTATGNVTLKVVAPGGTCASPFELGGGGSFSSAFNGSNQGDVGSCGGQGASRVHHFRPARSGNATITLKGDFWPAALYVRSGSCHGAELACNYQAGQWPTESVTVAVTAGTDYYVWTNEGSYTGEAVVQYTLTVAAP